MTLWVDRRGWDEPGVAVEAHDDVPPVVVDLGVAALAEQAAVVEVGAAAVGPMRDVVDLGV